MERIFLGKFGSKNRDQVEKKYYCAGPEGGEWYGDVKVGDYIFAACEGKIIGLWRAKEYTEMENDTNPQENGVLRFDEIKSYNDVSVVNHFTRYKYFIHDLNLVNKVTKSVRNLGFIPITTREGCPRPEDIDFQENMINIYVAFENSKLVYKEGDVRVVINNAEEMAITKIERFSNGMFIIDKELSALYDERNSGEGKYTIRELSGFAVEDHATNKKKFLIELISALEKTGYYKVSDMIKLYDNLLVGRKRSAPSKPKGDSNSNYISNNYDDDEDFDEEVSEYIEIAELLNFNPNLILYGPPGTGKTYATNKIIETYEKKYFNKKSSYREALEEKRVRCITFHQSYSYEEFIEGIRPVLSDEDGEVGYKLENGLFKEFCINAEKELIKHKENAPYIERIKSDSSIWKLSLGERKSDAVYNECLEKNEIAIGWLDNEKLDELDKAEILDKLGGDSKFGEKPTHNANTVFSFAHEMRIGDIVLIYNSQETIRMIGIVNSEYFHEEGKDYTHRRKVEWLRKLSYPINIRQYNDNKILTLKTLYRLSKISVSDILRIISANYIEKQSQEDRNQIKPYYMIIDEINRGNISKIFGELITLIEQDKRGRDALLPYSKKEFRVPGNLFIIGTMNTADRSIASIDTALRRRFTFMEIEPDSSILSKSDNNPIINDTIDLVKLLDKLNSKIIEKYDRDHRIGHAYLMNIDSLKSLYQTWYYKILPLLLEYFYNDSSSLSGVVGNNFFDSYGNIKYMSLDKRENGLSEFEENIRAIYLESSNG